MNCPPTNSLLPVTASENTSSLLITGSANAFTRAPVLALNFATRVRAWPPAWVKPPPANTDVPSADAASAFTGPFTLGLKPASSAPVVALTATRY